MTHDPRPTTHDPIHPFRQKKTVNIIPIDAMIPRLAGYPQYQLNSGMLYGDTAGSKFMP
jgi:hypothetical protein